MSFMPYFSIMQKTLRKLPYFLCYLCAFVLGMKQLREPDVWWQLLSGRWMLEHGQVTRTDVFSYTMAGKPWINVKWLYEIFIALLEKITGPEGVTILQAVVNVLIVYLLIRTLREVKEQLNIQIPVFAAVIPVLLFLAIVEYRMTGRPEMISHLMATLYLFILWRNPAFEWKKIFWLIPLQCLWANMHEGYPVGMVIIGAFAGGSFITYLINKDKTNLQQAIRISLLFAACAVAILLNPNTIQLWKQPFEIYRQVWANKYTTELYSVMQSEYWTIEAKWHIAVLSSVVLFWIARLLEGRKQKTNSVLFRPVVLSYLLLIPLFGYLSLTANRNIPFAQIVLFPSVPVMLVWLTGKLKLESRGFFAAAAKQSLLIASVVGIIFYISIVTNSFYKYTKSRDKYGIHVSMMHNPSGAANFIKEHKIKGTVFSDYFISSYMLWALHPDFKSYIDLRDLDVFPGKFFDEYFSMYNEPVKFFELDKKYKFNYIVLGKNQLSAVQRELYWGATFNLIYIDPVAAVYLRQVESNAYLNSDYGLQKLYNWPQSAEDHPAAILLTKLFNPAVEYTEEDEANSPIYAAKFYNQVKNYPTAIKLLLPALSQLEDNADAYSTLGTTYMEYASVLTDEKEKKQKTDSARIFLEQAIALDADKPDAYVSLAGLSMNQGNYSEAKGYLEKFVKLDDHNDYMYFLLGMCYRNTWKATGSKDDLEEFRKCMQKSLELNKQNGKAYLYMAEAYKETGDKDEARKNLKLAIASGNPLLEEENKLMEQLKTQLGVK